MKALAEIIVGETDHRARVNPRMGFQGGFDFGGVDVLATRENHVALSVAEV